MTNQSRPDSSPVIATKVHINVASNQDCPIQAVEQSTDKDLENFKRFLAHLFETAPNRRAQMQALHARLLERAQQHDSPEATKETESRHGLIQITADDDGVHIWLPLNQHDASGSETSSALSDRRSVWPLCP